MPYFRKKPVTIEARRVTDDQFEQDALLEWVGDAAELNDDDLIEITTLEGAMIANIGDWIIKGVEGEFYPCKNSVFVATYEDN